MRRWSPLAGALLSLLTAVATGAGPLLPPGSCRVEFRPAATATVGVPFAMNLTITETRSAMCTPVNILVRSDGRIKCVGQTAWTTTLDSGQTFSTIVMVEVPPNDTSELSATIVCPDRTEDGYVRAQSHTRYVVTDDTKVGVLESVSRIPPPLPDPRDKPMSGNIIPGQFPVEDSLWGTLKVEPVSIPTQAGPVDLMLSFAPVRQPCDSIHFSVKGENRLKIVGDTVWSVAIQAGQPYTRVLQVIVPENDTSWAAISMRCGGAHHSAAPLFVTTGSNLEYYSKNPWGRSPAQELEVKYRRATQPVGDQRVEMPVTLDSLTKLEQTPYLGEGRQDIWVNGIYYTRIKNEYKFHHWEPYTDWKVQQQRINDSIEAIPITARYDAKIGVRDSSELAYVRKLIPNLVFVGRIEGYDWYSCRTTKAVIYDLSAKNINVSLDLSILEPVVEPDSTRPEEGPAKPGAPDSGGMKSQGMLIDPQTTIFAEGFSGSWPGVWSAWDEDSRSGYDYWGRSSRTVYGSPYSVWCSGTGGRTDGGAYDSCMIARMQTGPIALSAYKDITLSYWVWADLPGPSCYDQFWVETSENGVTWDLVYFRNVSTSGWQQITHDLSGIQVHLRFSFPSNCGLFQPNRRGVYVDELVISGTLRPNLKPCALPGWSYPLVPANIRGTNQTTTLYAGESTFVDFAEENNGGSAAGAHWISLYLDDAFKGAATPTTLAAGDTAYCVDAGIVVATSGNHVLTLKCDANSSVLESNELDNNWPMSFYWAAPEITCRGYL